jgi:hypothetical protein
MKRMLRVEQQPLRSTHTGRDAKKMSEEVIIAAKFVHKLAAIFRTQRNKMADTEEELLLLLLVYRRCWPLRRRTWVHEIIRKRQELGEFHRLVQELRLDQQRFLQYFRMTPETFDNLLHVVGPHIRKQTTNYRKPISPEQRLAICLRYFVMILYSTYILKIWKLI